jgi:hypothetical protein
MPNGEKGIIMSNTTKKITVRFTIDFIEQTITGTKASFNKAGKGYGPEYEELASKTAAHPEFELVIKEQKKHSTKAKRVYDGLDFPFMEDYISIKSNADILMKEYEAVKQKADEASTKKYPLTKKWFLGTFSTEENPFDMELARKEISDFRIVQAKLTAANSMVASNAPAQQDREVMG